MNKNTMRIVLVGITCLTWVALSMVSCEKSSYDPIKSRGYTKHINLRIWDAPESEVEDE